MAIEIHEQPAPTRLAATVLLVRDNPYQVLLVRRHKGMHFASALVFPGGLVDAQDREPVWTSHATGTTGLSDRDRALRIAACRETFEETAIFLGHDQNGAHPGAVSPDATFLETIRHLNLQLDLDRLQLFAHWITPLHAPKRFDTYFFIAAAPDGVEAFSDGKESSDLFWMSPAEALNYTISGMRPILFPTKMNLQKLARSASSGEAIAAAASDQIVTVMPKVERFPYYHIVRIPAEAGYGTIEERIPAPKPAPRAD